MGDVGWKIANANLNTDLVASLPFTTSFGSLKAYRWGQTTLSIGGTGNASVQVAHNLNYAPTHHVFGKGTANYPFLDASSYPNAWHPLGGPNRWFGEDEVAGAFASVDSSNLTIETINAFKSASKTFKYYIMADKAEGFTGADGADVTGNLGYKQAPIGTNVFNAKEYELLHSTKYRPLQYYRESLKSGQLTLPAMFASYHDNFVEEGGYIDFAHGMPFAPFFLAWIEIGGVLREIPYCEFASIGEHPDYPSGGSPTEYEVAAWCDSTRIRVSVWRASWFDTSDFAYTKAFDAATFTITVLPFYENLAGLNYGE